jgi:hypothetical protein
MKKRTLVCEEFPIIMATIRSSIELVVTYWVFFAVAKLIQWTIKKGRKTAPLSLDVVGPKEDIPPLLDFDISPANPHPYRPWSSGKFVMTMGIKKIAQEDWLMLDNKYFQEQLLRRELLAQNREGVMQILPGAEAACVETLELIVYFLTKRYPRLFYRPPGKPDYIHNSLTNRTFRISAPYDVTPLEVAAQLIMEDTNLLVQGFGEDPEQYYL